MNVKVPVVAGASLYVFVISIFPSFLEVTITVPDSLSTSFTLYVLVTTSLLLEIVSTTVYSPTVKSSIVLLYVPSSFFKSFNVKVFS